MTDSTVLAMTAGDPLRFPSLASMRAAHTDLLKREHAQSRTPEMTAEIETFIRRGMATGVLLDAEADRTTAQSQLDYWATRLFRPGAELPDATLADFDPLLAPELDDALCPYIGLDAFRETQQGVFFGRERLIGELLKKLQAQRLLAVIGSSGSGKSSVVRAGLIPMLKNGGLPDSAAWVCLPPIVPGSNPLANLARLMLPADADAGSIRAEVDLYRHDAQHLSRVVAARDNRPIVLVVDQFEEVFTLCTDEAVRTAFVDNLIGLMQSPEVPHRVIVTIRTDFEPNVTKLPAFYALFQQGLVHVTPLIASELREAIEAPAALIGLRFEEGLVEALLHDTLGEPAALPLLQFTLLKLWEQRERNRVTMAAYQRLGGRRTLGQATDDFYARLITEEQVTARRILLKMVRPGEGQEITSNRVLRSGLYHKAEARDRIDRVLDKLIKARLVRVSEGDTAADEQIEVAHEALIRNWPQLCGWIEDERVTLHQRQRLTAAAEQWQRLDRDPSAVWRGRLLDEARHYDDLTELETDFIEVGCAADRAESERQLEETRKQQELEYAHKLAEVEKKRADEQTLWATKLRRRAVYLMGALGVALLLGIAAGVFGFESQRQARIALSRQLAAQSISHVDNQFDLALLLSLESRFIDDTVEARGSLLTVLERHPGLTTFLHGHGGRVFSVAFSPDGKTLASGNNDATIILWDVSNRQLPVQLGAPLSGHSRWVSSIAFSPDGKTLASGSGDNTIILWDMSDPTKTPVELGKPLKGHGGAVLSVAFSPDGKTLASGSRDKLILLWDVSNPKAPVQLSAPLSGHTNWVQSIAFSPDGKTLASGSDDKTIILWNVSNPKSPVQLGAPLTGHGAVVTSVAFSPDGKTLASGNEDKTIILWDVSNPMKTPGELGAPLKGHSGPVVSVAFNPDGKTLASGSRDTMIILWDVSNRQSPIQLGAPLNGHSNPVMSVAFSPDGKTLASGSYDTTIILWDMSNPTKTPVELGTPLKGHSNPVLSVAFSPECDSPPEAGAERCGKTLASGSNDQMIILWDVSKPKSPVQLGTPLTHTNWLYGVAFSPDGRTLASGSADKTIILWNVSNPKSPIQLDVSLKGHSAPVNSVAFSPDGKTLASGSQDNTIILWDVSNRQSPVQLGAPLNAHIAAVNNVAFSPDDKTLASGSDDKTIILWDVSNPTKTPVQFGVLPSGHTSSVNSVAFSPDGKTLASGSVDETIILWNVSNPKLPVRLGAPLNSHSDVVWSIAFSPDGKTLASGSADSTIILWDVSNPKTPVQLGAPLSGHTDKVYSVAFSPDGKTLASGSADKTIILWDVDLDSWRERACQMAHRNLTRVEWGQYLGDEPYRQTCAQWPAGDG
jgi:WD40 repeat protein